MQTTGVSTLRPPPGFAFAAMAMGVVAGIGVVGLLSAPAPGARLYYATVALLSLVLADALWGMRSWVGRVVDAWALACTGIMLLVDFSDAWKAYPSGELTSAITQTLVFVAVPCALLRWYVRHRAALLGLAPAPRDLVILRRLLAHVL